MKAKAAVAWQAKQPLSIEMIDVAGPKQGEVLLKVIASGVCHTDAFTLSGDDPEGAFPAVLGHEGGVEAAGEGVPVAHGNLLRHACVEPRAQGPGQAAGGCRRHHQGEQRPS